MINKDFFYLQYNKIDWKNQEKTKINSFINDYIIRKVISRHKGNGIALFDIGFGIGLFFKMLLPTLTGKYKDITIEGCEPSSVNYGYFLKKTQMNLPEGITINTRRQTFQKTKTDTKFDYITAIYVFPHFLAEDLERVLKKSYSILKNGGKFILVLAEERYLEKKLNTEQDLFIEKRTITYKGKQFREWLHYSEIPEIGKIVDYNREEAYYLHLFRNNNFNLILKTNLNDNGFICTLFVFDKV